MFVWLQKQRVVALAVLAGCLIVGAASMGLAVNGTGGAVIRACVNPSGGMRSIGDAASCKSNEQLLTWNSQGQPGPKGDKGDKGDAGENGSALTNIGALQGVACHTHNGTAGTVAVSTNTADTIVLKCVATGATPGDGGGSGGGGDGGGGVPTTETCNGIDDDRDGIIDELWPELGQSGSYTDANGETFHGTWVCSPDGTTVVLA